MNFNKTILLALLATSSSSAFAPPQVPARSFMQSQSVGIRPIGNNAGTKSNTALFLVRGVTNGDNVLLSFILDLLMISISSSRFLFYHLRVTTLLTK